jgi:phosphoribosylamine--glycine ligase
MKVLVIGSGGREHAICHAFKIDPRVRAIYCASGNAGIAAIAECVPVRPDDIASLAEFASQRAIDLTFVGGETSLALGVVDEFEKRGLRIIGPGKIASQLEASKSFAKDFMARHGVPTATYVTARSPGSASQELESGRFGDASQAVVVKADGLAAGKGVVVAKDRAEALDAINEMASLVGTAAAEKIVLEECLAGKEVSLLMFADGEDFILMPPVRDHKRIGEGDTGPNTGGMGTITDASLVTEDELQAIKDTIVRPTLRGCILEGFPFRGILFLGLMMTASGPKLLEYNVRFGDPETQAIIVRLESSLADICEAMLGGRLADLEIKWKPGSSACVILASQGYPAQTRIGDVISGLESASQDPNIEVFHGGTATLDEDGRIQDEGSASLASSIPHSPAPLITSGGRVLGVTATGGDLSQALERAYAAAAKISFAGMQFRRDIGR